MNFDKEHYIWVEKYRPKAMDEYIGNDHIKEKVKLYLESGEIPHLLLCSGPGTGKTTLARIIINHIDCDYLYVNASDENSVEVMRNKIRNFASTAGFKDIKIVILDEADFLTPSSQAALRNMMETFSAGTRFILTCNYIEKIIEPLQSRCQTYIVNPPSKKEVAIATINILDKEGVEYDTKDIGVIVNAHYPDIRKIINTCQEQTINNRIFLSTQDIIESNYFAKIIEILKSDEKPFTIINNIRQLIADNQIKHFEPLYRHLYESVDEYAKGKVSNTILIIAEHAAFDAQVVDKEINAVAMIIKIVAEIKTK